MIVLIAFILGMICVSAGLGMIYLPAGIIAAGAGLIVLAALLCRGTPPGNQ